LCQRGRLGVVEYVWDVGFCWVAGKKIGHVQRGKDGGIEAVLYRAGKKNRSLGEFPTNRQARHALEAEYVEPPAVAETEN
jgi:hypothetical protein